MSKMFKYIKNQVLLGNFTKDDLTTLVSRDAITNEEKSELLTLITQE